MDISNLVIIGSSTGGFRIVGKIFADLPKLNASIIVVQHMLKNVNALFKEKLDRSTGMGVKIAEDGEVIKTGYVYIAPSGSHLRIVKDTKIGLCCDGGRYAVRPSIDVTMKSLELKSRPGGQIIGVILTGMGNDGVEGIRHIKGIGGTVIAQNKDTSIIYGMPKAAYETGDVAFSLTLEKIRDKLIELCGIMVQKNSG